MLHFRCSHAVPSSHQQLPRSINSQVFCCALAEPAFGSARPICAIGMASEQTATIRPQFRVPFVSRYYCAISVDREAATLAQPHRGWAFLGGEASQLSRPLSPPAPVCSLPQLAGLPSCLAIWSRDKAWSTLISKHDVVIMACLQILFYLHLFVWLLLVLSLTSVRTSSLLLSPFTSWLLPAPGCPVCLSAIAYKTTTICSTYCLEFQFLVMHTWLVLQQ